MDERIEKEHSMGSDKKPGGSGTAEPPMADVPTEVEQSPGFWRIVWKRFRRDKFAMSGLLIVLFLFAVSYLTPVIANNKPIVMRWNDRLYFPAVVEMVPFRWIVKYSELYSVDFDEIKRDQSVALVMPVVPYSPIATSLDETFWPPSSKHWMGTDNLGRDVFSRMLHGAGVSLKVGLVAVSIALLIGVVVGALAGFYVGVIDVVLSRIIEVVICFPFLFLILAVIVFLPPSIYNIMIVIGITRWTSIARYTRGEFMKVREQEFTEAARALGVSDKRIIFRHILPNSLAPVLVAATFGVANAILIEAALSFLGLGIQPPTPSWGEILSVGRQHIEIAWWLATFPGLAIFLTVTAYNLLGEGLRDATDPKLVHPERR
jgi:peptide/nickel transport system permease protein